MTTQRLSPTPHPPARSDRSDAPSPGGAHAPRLVSIEKSVKQRIRIPVDAHPDHHLWRNGRLWWVAFTVIEEGWRQRRVRLSLQTDDVATARRRRDALFHLVNRAGDCEISLRFKGRVRGGKRVRARRERAAVTAAARPAAAQTANRKKSAARKAGVRAAS